MTEHSHPLLSHDPYEEFLDPINYDLEEAPVMGPRLAFFGDLVHRYGGPVLDVACGTGLYTLALAQQGYEAVGVDITQTMIDYARTKAAQLAAAQALAAPVAFLHADARTMLLGQRFAVAFMTGNTFMMLLTDDEQRAVLDSVRAHLTDGGRFAFEVRSQTGHNLRDLKGEQWFAYRDASDRDVLVGGDQQYDPESHFMYWTTYRHAVGAAQPFRVTRICCRFTPLEELNERIRSSGYVIEAQYGDFDRSPLSLQSPSYVTVCRAV
jgi:SAM-dependent methyltransferase